MRHSVACLCGRRLCQDARLTTTGIRHLLARNKIVERVGLIVLSLGISLSAQADTCPAGQFEVCLGLCLCVPDPQKVQEEVSNTAAPALADWMQRSRDVAVSEGIASLPPAIRQQLLPYYASPVLDAARYKIGSSDQRGLATAMLQNPDIRAVTLIDVIVFRTERDAADVALWAHELQHVQQYQEWGVQQFALRYTRDANAVEAPAYAIQIQVSKALRQAGR